MVKKINVAICKRCSALAVASDVNNEFRDLPQSQYLTEPTIGILHVDGNSITVDASDLRTEEQVTAIFLCEDCKSEN
ncbi:MAG: hypothetical protein RBG13Loki_4253 [Promethearchaeota archaeon CR_4]|nr:MAG: hypothetical protein RBG13Loki_4253 [Candidatus Lokiarchaeota archaeon CR_4]